MTTTLVEYAEHAGHLAHTAVIHEATVRGYSPGFCDRLRELPPYILHAPAEAELEYAAILIRPLKPLTGKLSEPCHWDRLVFSQKHPRGATTSPLSPNRDRNHVLRSAYDDIIVDTVALHLELEWVERLVKWWLASRPADDDSDPEHTQTIVRAQVMAHRERRIQYIDNLLSGRNNYATDEAKTRPFRNALYFEKERR